MMRTPFARIEARERDMLVCVDGADPFVIDLRPDLADADELARAFSYAFASPRLRAVRSVVVVLHAPLVQRTFTDLPPIHDADLLSPVIDVDEETRAFRAVNSDVAVAAEWVRGAEGSVAIVAIAELAMLERLEQGLLRAGRTVQRFLPMNGTSASAPSLPTARARARDQRRRRSDTVETDSTLAAAESQRHRHSIERGT